MDVGVQGEGDHVTAVGGACRARPVHRQGQFLRQARQGPAPEVELAGDHAGRVVLAAQYLPLPQGVVRVLHRQFVPGRRLAAAPCRVGGRQVTRQRGQRGAVGGDVVQHEQQHVLPLAGPEQRRPQRQIGREVETARHLLGEERVQAGPVRVHVDDGPLGPCVARVENTLVRHAVGVGEDGAQRLVAADHVVQGRGQRGGIHRAGEPQGQRDVVGRTRALETAEEPQPLLRVRQRHRLGPGHRGERPPGHRGLAAQPGGETGRGRGLEERAHLELDAQRHPDAAGETGGEQRMPAQLEEAVVGTDLRHAEGVGEQGAEDLLLRRARAAAGPGGGVLGRGQGLAVELAVGGERQGVQGDEGRRHHVLGQYGGERGTQRTGVRSGGAVGDGVGDEPLVAGAVLTDQDDGPADPLAGRERGLDLAELDPEAAQLDLVVGAAQVLQGAVGAPADEVAGAVHAAARVPVGAGGEPLRGQRRAAQVAAGQLLAGEVELSHHARGDRAQRRVQHVHPGVDDRGADGRRCAGTGDQRFADRGHDGGFGGAVGVDHAAAGGPAVHQGGVGGVAAHDQGGEVRQVHGRDGGERGRGDQRVGDGAVREDPAQGLVGQRAGRGDHQGGAPGEAHAQFEDRGVEAGRGELQHPAVRADRAAFGQDRGEGGQALVGDHHALGAAGGAGGVDDVGGVGHGQRRRPVRVRGVGRRCGGQVEAVQEQAGGGGRFGQAVRVVAGGEDQDGVGVVEHVGDAVGGVVRVDRQVGAAGLHHRQAGHDDVHRAGQQQGDDPLRAHAPVDEVVGEPVGPLVELRVRQRLVVGEDRGGVRGPGRLRLEQRRERRGGHRGPGTPPRLQQLLPLRAGEHVEAAQELLGGIGEALQDVLEPPADELRLPGGEQIRAVAHAQPHPLAGEDRQAERVVVVVGGVHAGDAQAVDGLREAVGVDRVALERRDGVEEFAAAEEGLDVGEAVVLVVHQLRLLVLQTAQQVGDGLPGVQPDADRQGVDEQADHVLHAGHLRRAAGDRAAEDDVVPAGETAQQDAPGGLHHGVDREVVTAGQGRDGRGQLLGELVVVVVRGLGGGGRGGRGQQGGLLDPGEGPAPRLRRSVAVLGGGPGEVVAVRRDPRQPGGVTALRVQDEQLLQHDRHRPAVEQDVVVRQHETEPPAREPYEGEAHQRRRGQVEVLGAVGGHERLEAPRLVLGRHVRQVDLLPGEFHLAGDDLHGLVETLVHEAGAQVRVPPQQGGGSRLQGRHVQGAFEVEGDLTAVHVELLLVEQGVVQHALLHR